MGDATSRKVFTRLVQVGEYRLDASRWNTVVDFIFEGNHFVVLIKKEISRVRKFVDGG